MQLLGNTIYVYHNDYDFEISSYLSPSMKAIGTQ